MCHIYAYYIHLSVETRQKTERLPGVMVVGLRMVGGGLNIG